ncbi:MAG: hypothetical protein WAN11_13975 [Syntrophobacteraceae bacterium]
MNLDEIIKNIQRVADELYPGEPEVFKLCETLITWERENISKATPRYKEQYKRTLDDAAKRMLKD